MTSLSALTSLSTRFAALAIAACACLPAHAGPVADRVKASGSLKVCIWPNYYGITYRNPRSQQLVGIDIDLSAELAKDLKLKLAYVESSFATLVADLAGDKCDVAMFSIGVTPEREKVMSFTRPYLHSDIYAITTRSHRSVRAWEDIDRPGIVVAVAAGTLMEPVMKASLKNAQLLLVRPPATREQELESGRADVFMTDYPYSRRLLDNADWAKLLSPPKPFNITSYAYAVKPGDEQWLRTLDEFVAKIKIDGRLDAAAKRNGLSEIVVRN